MHDLDRRKFLQGTLAASAAITLASCATSQTKQQYRRSSGTEGQVGHGLGSAEDGQGSHWFNWCR